MGRKIRWLCCFIFCLPAVNMVVASRITIYNENNNLRGAVGNDTPRTNILEIKGEKEDELYT